MNSRPTIVVFLGAYWPGHESTGPNISVRAMCEALSDQFDFCILALDRPFSGGPPLAETGSWHEAGYAKIRYLTAGPTGAMGLIDLLNSTNHELIVLNGLFDREFSLPYLLYRRAGLVPRSPLIMSPRGELSVGALSLKSSRKRFFLRLAARLQLHREVHFHATSDLELLDCRSAFPDNSHTLVPNIRSLFPLPLRTARAEGAPLRVAFVGRLTAVKRLDFALEVLASAGVAVEFKIFGPIADQNYWSECIDVMSRLPANIHVQVRGQLTNAEIISALAAVDVLLLPSVSENFGHAIFEALGAGTPVVIGNRTPWQQLEKHRAGFDLPVDDLQAFVSAIRRFSEMSEHALAEWRSGARALAVARSGSTDAVGHMSKLFFEQIRSSKTAKVRPWGSRNRAT